MPEFATDTVEQVVNADIGLVIQPGKKISLPNKATRLVAAAVIYSVFFPVVLIDIWVTFYQFIYFGIFKIPKIKKSDYVVFDREHLSKLSWHQRFNCIYCEYVNGTAAWVKAVAAQTEIYSCAIKHWHPAKGQDHQENFYSYRSFK